MIEFNPDTHIYTVNGVPYVSVTQVLSEMGLYGDAVNFFTDYGRDRGTFVHQIVEWDISGELDESTIDPALQGYYQAWKNFKQDTGFIIEASEKRMSNDMYQLAGTCDLIGKLNGLTAIIDIKTGAVGPATALQLAAYQMLYGPWARRYALRLNETGAYKLIKFTDLHDREIFLAALSLRQWKINNNIRG